MDAQPVKKNTSAESLPEKRKKGMIACLVISVIVIALYFVPYGRYVLYPFMLIYTFIHEMGHMILGNLVAFGQTTDGTVQVRTDWQPARLTAALFVCAVPSIMGMCTM